MTCGIDGPLRRNRAGWADVRTGRRVSHQRLSSSELLNETHLDCVDSASIDIQYIPCRNTQMKTCLRQETLQFLIQKCVFRAWCFRCVTKSLWLGVRIFIEEGSFFPFCYVGKGSCTSANMSLWRCRKSFKVRRKLHQRNFIGWRSLKFGMLVVPRGEARISDAIRIYWISVVDVMAVNIKCLEIFHKRQSGGDSKGASPRRL